MKRSDDDAGMTLIEVLIVVMIMGIITPAIVGAMIIAFRNTGDTRTRMVQSHHANLTATYLNEDVASSKEVTVNGAAGSACSGVPNKVRLHWQETIYFPNATSTTVDYDAAYGLAGSDLKRWYCEGGTVIEEKIVAHDVGTVTAVQPAANEVTLTVDQTDGNDENYSFFVGGKGGVRVDV